MRKSEHVSCSCGMCRRGRSKGWGKLARKQTAHRIRQSYRLRLKGVRDGADPDVDYFIGATHYTD